MNGPTNRLHFPAKIYLILENESPDIIRWHPNNKAFRIIDHSRFEREIIPKYFRHNQMSSVQRQLNLYGFKCVSRGEDKGSFYHSKFQRGDWEAAKLIRRCVSHSQFGLQNWKLPQDGNMKSFGDSNIKTEADLGIEASLADTTDNQTSAITETTSNHGIAEKASAINTSVLKKVDWHWPPAPVLEQQRVANQTILKAFNTCDLSLEVMDSAPIVSKTFQSASALTNRLGLKWHTSGDNEGLARSELFDLSVSQPKITSLSSNSDFTQFLNDFQNDFNGPSNNQGGDNLEELMFMCNDLDSFLEDCDAGAVW